MRRASKLSSGASAVLRAIIKIFQKPEFAQTLVGMTGKCYYEFGPFRLEPGERRLWRHDHRVDLPAKALDLLLVLVENSGSQISKGELISKVWPGTYVSAGNLTVNLSTLRTTLGDHDEKYIENVRGYGYRFKGPVTVVKVEDEDTKEAQEDYVKTHFVVEDEVIETEPFEGDPKAAPQENSLSGGLLPPQNTRDPGTEVALPPANMSPSLSPTLASQPQLAITLDTVTLPAAQAWLGLQNRWKLATVIALSIASIFGIAWYVGRREEPKLDARQLTTNATQVPLAAAAISPDGKYVAYANAEEIWVQAVQTGEMQFIAVHGDRRVYHLAWFPDSINLLVSTQDPQSDGSAIWKVSTLASTWRELGDESGEAAVSPDGTRIAYVSENGKEVWLEGSEGEEEKRVLAGGEEDSFHDLAWGPNGRRILFARVHVGAYLTDVGIESLDLKTSRITTVLPPDPGVRGMCASPDGRIIYSLAEAPPNQNTINLWEIRFDYRSGRVVSRPRRITNWPGSCIYSLSVTANGKCSSS